MDSNNFIPADKRRIAASDSHSPGVAAQRRNYYNKEKMLVCDSLYIAYHIYTHSVSLSPPSSSTKNHSLCLRHCSSSQLQWLPTQPLYPGMYQYIPFSPLLLLYFLSILSLSPRGSGEDGQLGIGNNEEREWVCAITALHSETVRSVVAGSRNSLAICDDGKVLPPYHSLHPYMYSFRISIFLLGRLQDFSYKNIQEIFLIAKVYRKCRYLFRLRIYWVYLRFLLLIYLSGFTFIFRCTYD